MDNSKDYGVMGVVMATGAFWLVLLLAPLLIHVVDAWHAVLYRMGDFWLSIMAIFAQPLAAWLATEAGEYLTRRKSRTVRVNQGIAIFLLIWIIVSGLTVTGISWSELASYALSIVVLAFGLFYKEQEDKKED